MASKASNTNLHNAKKAKNDEFYTQLSDIEKELRHYKKHFRDKTVFCNCDDPEWSNFWQYFSLNFDRLQLRRLIATHYEIDKPSYLLEMWRDDSGVHTNIKHLSQNGDFRSPESIEFLKEADIVVTNPPFSLFREYVAQLMKYEKKFLIIGNKNAITYKEFFPLLKDNKAWIGYNAPCEFGRPDGTITKQVSGLTRWFTNLDIPKRHEPLIMVKRYDPELYPHYDNYDAINCDKVADIPIDYFESWGVLHADYALLNKDEWEITRSDAERHWIIPAGGTLRDELREHAEGYREHIEAVLTESLYCNGEVGVPITVLDALSPDQHEIVGADFELAQPQLLDTGKFGTGRFYIQPETIETTHTHTHTQEALQQNCHQTQDINTVPELSESQLRSSTNTAQNNAALFGKPSVTPEHPHQQVCSNLSRINNTQRIEEAVQFCKASAHMDESLFTYCTGIIGVPITFLDSYSIEQFSILGVTLGNTCDYPLTKIYTKAIQHNRDKTTQGGNKVNTRAAIAMAFPPSDAVYYTADNHAGYLLSIYPRILIRRR